MSQIVEELKSEHQFLVERVTEVKKLIGSPKAADGVRVIKKGLLAHLGKEDRRLYPALYHVAQQDKALAELLENFARDMERITTAAIAFFEKYEIEGNAQGIEFARDFGALVATLSKRIHAEETLLYPEFDRLDREGKFAGFVAKEEAAPVQAKEAAPAPKSEDLAEVPRFSAEGRPQAQAPASSMVWRQVDMSASSPSQTVIAQTGSAFWDNPWIFYSVVAVAATAVVIGFWAAL